MHPITQKWEIYGVDPNYWQDDTFHDSREFSEVPHHSFQLEHDAVRVLDAAGVLRWHEPGNSKTHRKNIDEQLKVRRCRLTSS